MTDPSPPVRSRPRLGPGLLARLGPPLVLLAILSWTVVRPEPRGWEVATLEWIHRQASPGLDRVMLAVTRLGTWVGVGPLSLLLTAWLVRRRRWREVLFFLLAIFGAWGLSEVAKGVYGRVRPSLWTSPAPESWFGFPSGHALATMTLALAAALLTWQSRARWWVVGGGVCLVLAVAFSRLYLGVHYPSDVLGAWFMAAAWVALLHEVLLPRGHR